MYVTTSNTGGGGGGGGHFISQWIDTLISFYML